MPMKQVLSCLLLLCAAAAGRGQVPQDALQAQEQFQQQAQQSQQRVEALDDETMRLVAGYNRELQRYEDLQTYNANLRQLLASQAAERDRLQAELGEIEVTRQAIVPLMVEMVEVLAQFVDLDQPMLSEERQARVASLRSIIGRADVDIAEKYRRVIEAYQIEAEYGQTLEAYESPVLVAGREITVDVLRVGRVGLYYLTLDGQQAGIWNQQSRAWQALPGQYLDEIAFALRVAREQAPPNLIDLPLWTGAPGQ